VSSLEGRTHLPFFVNVDKTRTYIERSGASPLEISLKRGYRWADLKDAFSLVIPHIHRVKALQTSADVFPDSMLSNVDLSSLRLLDLCRVTTRLPWNNLANLKYFSLVSCTPRHDLISRLLDFFDSAPLLEDVALVHSTPKSSSVPPGD
jgi:hypothetical protein